MKMTDSPEPHVRLKGLQSGAKTVGLWGVASGGPYSGVVSVKLEGR